MKTVIIDYGSGNLRSAEKSTILAAKDLDMDISVTSSPDEVRGADRIILPGVGAFADCMAGLNALEGMRSALEEAVIEKARPFLGICVGMQLLACAGLEHGRAEGLGWIAGEVEILSFPDGASLKIPHMGWNNLEIDQAHPILHGINSGDHAYFVHSFQYKAADNNDVIAHVDYGGKVNAIIGRNNIVGTQFHPEKSQQVGLKFLENFLKWSP